MLCKNNIPTASILWSVLNPSITSPKTTCLPSKSKGTLAKSHWLKPLRDCQNLLWISLLPIQIRFCSGAGKTSLSFSFMNGSALFKIKQIVLRNR